MPFYRPLDPHPQLLPFEVICKVGKVKVVLGDLAVAVDERRAVLREYHVFLVELEHLCVSAL